VAPLKKVTVPVAPVALLLTEEIVAVNVTFAPAATVVAPESAVAVVAFDTITLSVTGPLGL